MKKLLKFVGILIGAFLGLVLAAVLVLSLIAAFRLNRVYEISVPAIPIPEGEEAIERGEHLTRAVSGCSGCHGEDLGGSMFIDVGSIAQIYAPNLTTGEGGIGALFSPEDWVRALRHGVGPDGRPLLFMPSQNFRYYSDEDLGAIIAYIRSLPPVDRETPPRRLSIVGRMLYAMGSFGITPAESIDHNAAIPQPPPEDETPEYGEFLVTVANCRDCHGENLNGGRVAPDDPFAPNLTQAGELSTWTEEDFFTLIRTGVHPSGRQISPAMPWQTFRNMTDTELRAIWAYLQELPPLPVAEE